MDVVVPLHLKAERRGEGQVIRLHCVDVHLLNTQPQDGGQTKYVQFLTLSLPLPETSAAKDRHASAPGSFQQHNIKAVTHPPTLMRQALLTSCLGSTTSTSGSLIATSLMHDISKPYTFSHPDTKAQTQSCQFTENTWHTAGGV